MGSLRHGRDRRLRHRIYLRRNAWLHHSSGSGGPDRQPRPAAQTGSATGFYQVLRNIGLSVGRALGAAILLSYTRHGAIYPAVGGFTTSLLVSCVLGVVTAVVSYVLPGRRRANEQREIEEREIEILSIEEAELAGAGFMLDRAEESIEEGASD